MGEPVSVIQKPSNQHGVIRFETNRWFTGMGHESYDLGDEVFGDRPADEIARTLLDSGEVSSVHVYGQYVAASLRPGCVGDGLKERLEDLFVYYKPGVEIPSEDSFT